MKTTFNTVDEYISRQSAEVQILLEQIRQTIKQAAPEAEEVISYQMPAYKFHGILVYFAAFKNHIGFYATPNGHAEFKEALSAYKQGKGSVQFPIDKPIPLDLITEIVKFRASENRLKAK
ncbi:iron chaperone [Flavobacterium sp.]|uniref:iron chaperone n=1 Tax=Flavobacterium sp. TaxID=239 RepID=UPI0037925637